MLLKVYEGLRNIAIVYRETCRAESVYRLVMLIRHHHIHHHLLGGRFYRRHGASYTLGVRSASGTDRCRSIGRSLRRSQRGCSAGCQRDNEPLAMRSVKQKPSIMHLRKHGYNPLDFALACSAPAPTRTSSAEV